MKKTFSQIVRKVTSTSKRRVEMRRPFQGPRCTSTVRLNGKVVVITGANTGIGKETARDLSKRGAHVILACRDMEKSRIAAEEIQSETGNKVDTVQLDLASLASVREAAQELLLREKSIHILINNAGVMLTPHWTTADGFEMQFGVNHLGHFLFTLLLLDRIKASAPARIINLSSVAHINGKINFSDLMFQHRKYDATQSYCQSKLANILFTKELARQLHGTGVTAYAVHPGVVQTELGRHLDKSVNSLTQRSFNFFGRFLFKTAEMGAQTTIYCAVEEDLAEETGKYYSDCSQKQPISRACDVDTAIKLWQVSLDLVGLK